MPGSIDYDETTPEFVARLPSLISPVTFAAEDTRRWPAPAPDWKVDTSAMVVKDAGEHPMAAEWARRAELCSRFRRRSRVANSSPFDAALLTRFTACKKRAHKQGQKWDVTAAELLEQWHRQGGRCHFTGSPLAWEKMGVRSRGSIWWEIQPEFWTPERLRPELGWVSGNVVWTTAIISYMKRNIPEQLFLAQCRAAAAFLPGFSL